MTKNKVVGLNTLPLTSTAAQQHLFRIYYHEQTWLGNKRNPEEWFGNMTDSFLVRIQTTQLPAPGSSLNMSFCSCNKGGGSARGYRKLRFHCSIACANCHGQSCLNAAPIEGSPE
ncbi:hypothetical protein AVEN_115530-1 [Araneus ventricosus]|uniref:Uncharacterized protein n=1 Tax=Araneus ventricosus TaxID=182803 RepID=A0A4Y2CK99_ARAVE|nr:hypothetical protein AVEN_115530-1 [Araneus ventricosus]